MKKTAVFEAIIVLSILFFGFMLFLSVSAGPSGAAGNWSTSSVNATGYMYAGSGDRLYIFNVIWNGDRQGDTEITALSPEGRVEWTYKVEMPWSAINQFQRRPMAKQYSPWELPQMDSVYESCPVFAADGDTMYLYLRNTATSMGEKVVAVRDGHVIWERGLVSDVSRSSGLEDVWLKVVGDRLYAYRSYNLSVFRTDGTLLFSIRDVSDPPSVDPRGNIYVTKVVEGPEILTAYDYYNGPIASRIPVPSNRIASYYPNGTLRWETSINGMPARQAVDRKQAPDGCDMPLYNRGRLYVPLETGLVALDTEGSAQWNVSTGENVSLLNTMPFGPDGTVYMIPAGQHSIWPTAVQVIYAIGLDGNLSVVKTGGLDTDLMSISQGVGYFGHIREEEGGTADVGTFLNLNLTAVDLRDGSIRWNRTIVPAKITAAVADRQNVVRLFEFTSQGYQSIFYTEDHPELLDRTDLFFLVQKSLHLNVVTGGDIVYVGYYLVNYEYPEGYGSGSSYTSLHNGYSQYGYPALLGRSRICYASGVAALDADGNVLWNRPLDSMLTSMAAGNRIFYFGTQEGGLSAVRNSAAVGFTVTAALYLFFRFFMVGAVARARSRINDNVNRNRVLALIKKQPGNTMYDIARGLRMNAGTVRYHLLILGLNHRIVTFREGKYVRYFGNSGAYSGQDREIISLLRRDWARALLTALLDRDNMSNVELARALGVSEPAVSGYMRELAKRGIVQKKSIPGGIQYSIRDECKEEIARALEKQ